MRGKVLDLLEDLCAVGITPAYAGKSTVGYEESIAYRDHPRLCGEKATINIDKMHKSDHPRLCGEKSRAGKRSHRFVGSPPPMRGKGVLADQHFSAVRITPAYAGKSGGGD